LKLDVLERMVLDKILPQIGSYKLLKEIQILKSQLNFSKEEREQLNFKGIYKCKSCGITNIDLIQNQIEKWNEDIEEKPEEKEANKILNEIMNFKSCPECHVEMQFTGQIVWQKVKTEGGELKALEKDITIKPQLKILISKILDGLDKKGNLTEDQTSLFKKFIGFEKKN